MDFIEYIASEELEEDEKLEQEDIDWAWNLVESFKNNTIYRHHEGDCTNYAEACHLCVFETLLKEYEEYRFGWFKDGTCQFDRKKGDIQNYWSQETMKKNKHTLVQYIAADAHITANDDLSMNTDVDNIKVTDEMVEKHANLISVMIGPPSSKKTLKHDGDCVNSPGPCSLCIVKEILEEYYDYYFFHETMEELEEGRS